MQRNAVSGHPKKVVVSAHLWPTQLAALRRLSEDTNVPVAEYIRAGVELVLEKAHHAKAKGDPFWLLFSSLQGSVRK